MFHHGVQHLCGSNHGFPAGHALCDNLLLDDGDFGEVNLHAHVASGHHDAVRSGQNVRHITDALLIFNFCNDLDAGILLVQQAANLQYIGGAAYKGGNIVKALLDAKENILPVPLAHVRHGQPHIGHINALAVLHHTVVFHPAADRRRKRFQHG